MKRLVAFAVLACLPLALNAQTHIKFKQSGEFANFSTNPTPLSTVSVSVSRNASTGTATTASLNYTAFTIAPDFSSETVTQIVGEIPASDFTGDTTRRLVLDFDTSQLDPTTSFNQTCTVDLNLLTETCSPVTPGFIHLEFAENGLQRTHVLDFNEVITSGSTTTRIRQTSDNSTANMQGTIFGMAFTSTTATVGVNKDSTLEIFKN